MRCLPIFLKIIGLISLIGLIGTRPVFAQNTSRKLGIFVIESSDGGQKVINACPKMVTFYDPQNNQNRQNLLRGYKTKCPAGIAIVRIHDGVAEKQVDFKLDPVKTADEFFSIMNTQVNRLGDDKRLVDYLSATNEFENYDDEGLVLRGDETKWQWVGKFWTRLAQNIKQAGFRPNVGDINVGHPTDIINVLNYLIPTLREVKKLGGAWSYHGYTIDYSMNASDNTEGNNSLRYRQFYDFFRKNAPDLSDMPILITETGAAESGNKDKGYMPDNIGKFKQWMEWYDGEIGKDNYVVGATIFQSGDTGQWASFNTDYIAEWLCTRLGGTDCKVTVDKCTNKPSKAEEFKQFITDLFKRNISQLKRINQGNLPPLNIDSGGALADSDCPDPAADSAIAGPQQHNIAASRIQPPTETSSTGWWQNFKDKVKDAFSFGNQKAEEYASSTLPPDVASDALTYQDQLSGRMIAEGKNTGNVLGLSGSKDRAMEKALPLLQCAHLPAGVGQCSETGSLLGEPEETISGGPSQYPIITPPLGCGGGNGGGYYDYSVGQCVINQTGYCSVSCLAPFFGGDVTKAKKAAQICYRESGGNPFATNKGCLPPNPSSQDYSLGLFQINLLAHCAGALENEWKTARMCTILDQNKLTACENRFYDAVENIRFAVRLSGGGTNWTPWSAALPRYCNIQ